MVYRLNGKVADEWGARVSYTSMMTVGIGPLGKREIVKVTATTTVLLNAVGVHAKEAIEKVIGSEFDAHISR